MKKFTEFVLTAFALLAYTAIMGIIYGAAAFAIALILIAAFASAV